MHFTNYRALSQGHMRSFLRTMRAFFAIPKDRTWRLDKRPCVGNGGNFRKGRT